MSNPVVFVNHLHTHESNKRMKEIKGIWNYGDYNHAVDLIKFVESIPKDIDLVFNITEHWGSSVETFESLEDRVVEKGGEFELFESHASFELDGRKVSVINSVECSVEKYNVHFLLCGVPVEDERTFYNISFDEFMDEAEKVEWAMPAHPFTPHYKIPDTVLRRFYREANDRNIDSAVGFSSGYTGFFNRVSHGKYRRLHELINGVVELRGSDVLNSINPKYKDFENVASISWEFEVPVISEMDIHCAIPEKLEGAGVLGREAIKKLFEGEINTDEILKPRVLSWEDTGEGTSWREFFQTFPGVLPLYKTGIYRKFLPYEKEEFDNLFESFCKSLENINPEEIRENTRDPIEILKEIL